jgi:hypothetical protein
MNKKAPLTHKYKKTNTPLTKTKTKTKKPFLVEIKFDLLTF